ncbi:hypothetical protein JCM10213_001825 [Rhodosporidiobolus nylandii]
MLRSPTKRGEPPKPFDLSQHDISATSDTPGLLGIDGAQLFLPFPSVANYDPSSPSSLEAGAPLAAVFSSVAERDDIRSAPGQRARNAAVKAMEAKKAAEEAERAAARSPADKELREKVRCTQERAETAQRAQETAEEEAQAETLSVFRPSTDADEGTWTYHAQMRQHLPPTSVLLGGDGPEAGRFSRLPAAEQAHWLAFLLRWLSGLSGMAERKAQLAAWRIPLALGRRKLGEEMLRAALEEGGEVHYSFWEAVGFEEEQLAGWARNVERRERWAKTLTGEGDPDEEFLEAVRVGQRPRKGQPNLFEAFYSQAKAKEKEKEKRK